MRRPLRPYVMRGAAVAAAARPTVLDPPDTRVPALVPRRLTPEQLRAIERPGVTDPRLRATDRLLDRWASAPTSDLIWPGLAQMHFLPRSIAVPPLPDRENKLIDAAVRTSPSWAGIFVIMWYRAGYTAEEIGEALKIRRRQAVYEERQLVLAYFLGRFLQADIPVPSLVGDD